MGLFGKKKGLVGVDIGSSAIKAVELKVGGKGRDEYQLLNIGIEPLPPEAIVDGAIMDAGAVIDAIQRLFQDNRIKTAEISTGLSGNAVIVKKISLPQMSPEELAESIHWEAEQYIPFDIQDVALDYKVIEGSGSGGNMDVLLVAVKKDKIGEYTSAITQAGRTPSIGDVDVFALQNCYEINYGADSGRVVALLNIGASIMNINVVKGGVSIFNRDIAAGGNQYTDAIQKDLNLSFEQAEALKKGEQVEGASRENLYPILQAVSENIAMEIQKTFDFFRATSQEDRIDQIYLSGGTARIHGLRELLAERFGAPVELLNPFLNVRYSEKDFNPEVLEDLGAAAAIAVGLAARRMGDRGINLLATERKTKAPARVAAGPPGAVQAYLLLGLFAGGAAVACAGLWWFESGRIKDLDARITADEKRQRDLQAIKAQVDQFQARKATLENKVHVIERLRLSQKSPVHLLDEISKALPDYVWLLNMDETRGGLAFKGQSNSLAAVADFMSALQRSGWFPTVDLSSMQEQQNLVNFDLTGQFKDPEVAAKEDAAKQAAAASARPGPSGR